MAVIDVKIVDAFSSSTGGAAMMKLVRLNARMLQADLPLLA